MTLKISMIVKRIHVYCPFYCNLSMNHEMADQAGKKDKAEKMVLLPSAPLSCRKHILRLYPWWLLRLLYRQ